MGNIIKITSQQLFGLDKDKPIEESSGHPRQQGVKQGQEIKKRNNTKKYIYPIPLRGRGLYAFVRLTNE